MEWQPIETAPRVASTAKCGEEGPYILLSNEYGTWVGAHCPRYISGFKPENPWSCMMLNVSHIKHPHKSLIPTHWMPLPEPPK